MDAATQIYCENSTFRLLPYARQVLENKIKREHPSTTFVQIIIYSFSLHPPHLKEKNYNESAWVNTFKIENNNLWSYGFSTEFNDLLFYNNDSVLQQWEACNSNSGSIHKYQKIKILIVWSVKNNILKTNSIIELFGSFYESVNLSTVRHILFTDFWKLNKGWYAIKSNLLNKMKVRDLVDNWC